MSPVNRGEMNICWATHAAVWEFKEGSSDLSKIKQNTPKVFTHEAGAVLAERGFDVGGLDERVDEAHLAVEQGAGLHEVVDHLLPADLAVSAREGRQQ